MLDTSASNTGDSMRALTYLFSALVLTACSTPESLQKTKEIVRIESKQDAKGLMICISEKTETEPFINTNVRPTKNGYQISITAIQETTIYDLILVEESPQGGSVGKYHSVSLPQVQERFVRHVLACQ
jgi:predicted membrane GTPase involved in stress response